MGWLRNLLPIWFDKDLRKVKIQEIKDDPSTYVNPVVATLMIAASYVVPLVAMATSLRDSAKTPIYHPKNPEGYFQAEQFKGGFNLIANAIWRRRRNRPLSEP